MNRYVTVILSLLIFSCQMPEDADPANSATFIRFHGTPDNNEAVLAIESADGGYALLSNMVIESGVGDKINLIKTTVNGHLLWDSTYATAGADWSAASFMDMTSDTLVKRGYLIIGDEIKGSTTDLLLLKVNPNGEMEVASTIPFSEAGVRYRLHGRAVTLDEDENFLVLGNIEGHPTKNVYVAKINSDDMTILWSRAYEGGGAGQPMARIFRDATTQELWWGTPFTDNASQNGAVQLIRSAQNAESPINGAPLGSYDFDETPQDFCAMTGGFAITGTTNETGVDDIFVMRVDRKSNVMYALVLENEGAATGVSISRTSGNSVVVLGTVATSERRNDLLVAKIGPTGAVEWTFTYGSADNQEAASVRETSDGSYLIFGTTSFVNEEKLMLVKVNKDGKLY